MNAQTEITVGRSPVQIVEIQTQRCANEFGCAPCQAGLGTVDTSDLTVNFAQAGTGSGYAGTLATVTRVAGGVQVVSTGGDPTFRKGSSPGFSGDVFRYVTIEATAVTELNLNDGSDGGTVFYESLAGPYSTARAMPVMNRTRPFRGLKTLDVVKPGQRVTLCYDAATSTGYATDWQTNTVTGLRFDFGNAIGDTIIIHSITVSTESPFNARGSECYRTRSTCQNLPNFRSIVDGHLTPTLTLRDGDAIDISLMTTTGNAYFVAERVRFDTTPAGTIFAVGSASNFAYLGVTGSNLVFAAGGNAASNQARATVAASGFAGRTVTLIAEVDDVGNTANLWEFDPVTRALSLVATDAADTALTAAWAGATDGQVGNDGGITYGTEGGGDWAGRIGEVRAHDAKLFDGRESDVFKLTQYFGRPNMERPADDIFIEPYLADVSTAPTKVSLGGSNKNTTPLGNRASVQVQMDDAPGNHLADDPYRSDRLTSPLTKVGSYWAKWRVRQKFGRVGARLIVYEGYKGQALADMTRREYLMDAFNIASRERIVIKGRDILAKAQIDKAQVPIQSPGLLATALATTGETTIQISNATIRDYPAPGTVKINKELITYSATAVNGTDSSIIDLTIVARASDRSEPSDHDVDDGVQLCRRFTNRRVASIMTELLADDAEIEGQFLDLANWDVEDDSFLSAYVVSTVITEPTSVSRLVGTLVESAGSFIFWDERSQLVRLEALKALSETPVTITDDRDVISDTFSIMEKPREQATRVQVYYNPIDFTEKLDDPADFLNGYIDADTDLEDVDAYGTKQIRTVLSRWINTNAQATQTASRLANRYQDVPIEVTFALDAKNRDLWIGDRFFLQHFQLVNADGDLDTTRVFIITSAEEVVAGEIVKYTAEDATLAGFIYLIASNAQGDYTGDVDIDGFYGFITDAAGLYSDGTPGAKIS